MKVLYQFALKHPTEWQEIDAKDWHTLPQRPIPKKGELGGKDNAHGWLRNVSVQGITNEGFDHVAIEPITIGLDEGVKMTSWNDDPDDYPVGERNAIVWTILPLAPDPKLGMAINTRQSCIRYCEGERYDRLIANIPQNTTVRPWTEFIPPADEITRHGVWLDNPKLAEHISKAPQAEFGWMHWNEHLPDSECELDAKDRRVLKEQRKQGRYHQAEHTITYYCRSTARAVGYASAGNEDALELSTASSSTQSFTANSGTNLQGWTWTTPSTEPNVADWPSGVYHVQFNCSAASAGITYGHISQGDFKLLQSDLATVRENQNGTSNFTGTGLKLLSTGTWNPGAGLASDVYSVLCIVSGSSHGDAITLTLNTTDSYADGPWTTAVTITPDMWQPNTEQPLFEKDKVVAY